MNTLLTFIFLLTHYRSECAHINQDNIFKLFDAQHPKYGLIVRRKKEIYIINTMMFLSIFIFEYFLGVLPN